MADKTKKQRRGVFKKARVLRGLRNAFIGAVVLLVLFVGAGIAYTYIGGPENVSETPSENEEETKSYAAPFSKPKAPAADADVGVSVQAITSPVEPGDNASLSVRTIQGAECTIVVEYDEVKSDDSGLTAKVADEYGMVSWAWTVEENVPEGEWPVEVTCSRNEKSGVVIPELVVGSEQEPTNP